MTVYLIHFFLKTFTLERNERLDRDNSVHSTARTFSQTRTNFIKCWSSLNMNTGTTRWQDNVAPRTHPRLHKMRWSLNLYGWQVLVRSCSSEVYYKTILYFIKAMKAINYAKFINLISSSRKPSPIRVLTAIKAQCGPSMISLAGGSPNPHLFPFKEATFSLRGGNVLVLNEKEMNVALQYDASPGNAGLLEELRKLQNHYHHPPLFGASDESRSTDICVTYGATDGVSKSFEMLVNPGDAVLVEAPVCPVIIAALQPLGCKIIPIATDDEGILPESLSSACRKFSSEGVKFLLTTPSGQIPTGASTSTERRKGIYEIAHQYDFLILENDPYYMIQYEEFKPSYLSLDVDGRVLRFDSFSTTLSPGLRVGFVTGPKALVSKIVLHVMSSSMHVSTLSQILVYEYLKKMGLEGFDEHAKNLCKFYKSQRNTALEFADKHLNGLAKWNVPNAGTCLWLKLEENKLNNKAKEYIENNEVLLAGNKFGFNSKQFDCNVMVPFADHPAQDIEEAFKNLSNMMNR